MFKIKNNKFIHFIKKYRRNNKKKLLRVFLPYPRFANTNPGAIDSLLINQVSLESNNPCCRKTTGKSFH